MRVVTENYKTHLIAISPFLTLSHTLVHTEKASPPFNPRPFPVPAGGRRKGEGGQDREVVFWGTFQDTPQAPTLTSPRHGP